MPMLWHVSRVFSRLYGLYLKVNIRRRILSLYFWGFWSIWVEVPQHPSAQHLATERRELGIAVELEGLGGVRSRVTG